MKSHDGFFYVQNLAGMLTMCDLTNQQAYDYYHEAKKACAKDYWYNFLKSRADRGVEGAQAYVDKIGYYTSS